MVLPRMSARGFTFFTIWTEQGAGAGSNLSERLIFTGNPEP